MFGYLCSIFRKADHLFKKEGVLDQAEKLILHLSKEGGKHISPIA